RQAGRAHEDGTAVGLGRIAGEQGSRDGNGVRGRKLKDWASSPPPTPAELLRMMSPRRSTVAPAKTKMPPPLSELFAEIVESGTYRVPVLSMPPPPLEMAFSPGLSVPRTVLREISLQRMVAVPSFSMPPPPKFSSFPCFAVLPATVANE